MKNLLQDLRWKLFGDFRGLMLLTWGTIIFYLAFFGVCVWIAIHFIVKYW